MAADTKGAAVIPSAAGAALGGVGWRLAAFYCMYFATLGVMLPFWPLWLESQQLNAAEVGLVLAASFWVQILSKPLISNIADRSGKHRAIMEALPLVALVGYACFPAVSSLGAFLILAILVGGTYPVLLPLGESLALHTAGRHGVSYGRIRSVGSVAAILSSLGIGRMIVVDGPGRILGTIAFGVAATAAACSLLPEVKKSSAAAKRRSIRPLFTTPFILFLLASGITQASHATFLGFSSIHWHTAGHSETWIGALWAIGIFAEIILFLNADSISRRLNPLTLISIGGYLRDASLDGHGEHHRPHHARGCPTPPGRDLWRDAPRSDGVLAAPRTRTPGGHGDGSLHGIDRGGRFRRADALVGIPVRRLRRQRFPARDGPLSVRFGIRGRVESARVPEVSGLGRR